MDDKAATLLPPMQWTYLRSRATVKRVLYVLLCWLAFSWLDPIGFDAATSAHSKRLAERLMAPSLGGSDDLAQGALAQVLVTDADIGAGKYWPVDYYNHYVNLERILEAKPAAIFVDIFFSQERAGGAMSFDDFIATLAGARDEAEHKAGRPIPLIFAAGTTEQHPLPALTHNQVGIGLAASGWKNAQTAYPMAPEEKGELPSAAYALYRQLCGIDRSEWGVRHCPDKAAVDSDFRSPMQVFWGSVTPPEAAFFATQESLQQCRHVGDAPLSHWRESLLLISQIPLAKLDEALGTDYAARQRCPFTLTLSASQIDSVTAQQVLADRVVFYGADVSAAPDLHETPVHGLLPGINTHSMAFYNLLHWGERYFHYPPPTDIPGLEWGDVASLLTLALVSVVISAYGRRISAMNRRQRCVAQVEELGVLMLCASIIVLTAVTVQLVLRWPVANTLGILGFAAVLIEMGGWHPGTLTRRLLRFAAYLLLGSFAALIGTHHLGVPWPVWLSAIAAMAFLAVHPRWRRKLLTASRAVTVSKRRLKRG